MSAASTFPVDGKPAATLAIVGWCEQGRSAVRYPRLAGHEMTVVDDTRPDDLPEGVRFVPWDARGAHAIATADVVVRCPATHPSRIIGLLATHRSRQTPDVTSATRELLEVRGTDRVVAVTGTKGKSSTAAMIAHVLGRETPCVLAGNCGVSPLDVIASPADTWVVLELANFQTIDLPLAPRYAAIRPVTADHLDWHASLSEYIQSKRQLFEVQGSDAVAVCDATDANSLEIGHAARGAVATMPSADTYVDPARRLIIEHERVACLDPGRFPGRHGIGNVLAAVATLRAVGVDGRSIGRHLESFPGLRHRLEELHPLAGVRIVNDSHSTAIGSTIAALESVEGPIVLLLGGDAKRADLTALAAHVRRPDVHACVTFGSDGPEIAKALSAEGIRRVEQGSFVSAVRTAIGLAPQGACVLLSPACASTDEFGNAAERGDAFCNTVEAIRADREPCG